MTAPIVICHDQEPLNWNWYQNNDSTREAVDWVLHTHPERPEPIAEMLMKRNLRSCVAQTSNINDATVLVHSEINSPELEIYEKNNYIGAFFWSNAILSRDWYRHAWCDPALLRNNAKFLFNVYNRDWGGTREYRLWFTQEIVDRDLLEYCNMKFSSVDGIGNHYTQHEYQNTAWMISRRDLETFFVDNTNPASSSADYSAEDYNNCVIDVVLETLFDDPRIFLTEKSLRPIACGVPFILFAGPGSLEFLKKYGFNTFSPIIDETYDQIQDPTQRAKKILNEMERLTDLSDLEISQLNEIAKHNQRVFFSDEFFDQIINEFVDNVDHAINLSRQYKTGNLAKQYREMSLLHPAIHQHVFGIKPGRSLQDQIALFGNEQRPD